MNSNRVPLRRYPPRCQSTGSGWIAGLSKTSHPKAAQKLTQAMHHRQSTYHNAAQEYNFGAGEYYLDLQHRHQLKGPGREQWHSRAWHMLLDSIGNEAPGCRKPLSHSGISLV